jgi:dihydrofolate synthase/folylpolyglutamate synthase
LRLGSASAGPSWEVALTVSYRKILKYLYSRERQAMKYGLEGVRRLLASLENPEAAFPSVLVAGSNGKGSTAVIVASILKAAGYRTGLYTSPHLIDFKERIRVDGKCIEEGQVELLMKIMGDVIEKQRSTFFEATTAMAFKHFLDSRVDIAVLEVGLGGRFDATNASYPALSVITSISREHTEILGSTVDKIAGEKAGVLRAGGRAVLGFKEGPAAEATTKSAEVIGASLSRVGVDVMPKTVNVSRAGTSFTLRWKGDWDWGPTLTLAMPGRHQARNAATAALAAMSLNGVGFKVSLNDVARGIKKVNWPGRFQVVGTDANPCVLDVAHNPASAQALSRTFQEVYPGRAAVAVVGMSTDKDHGAFMSALLPRTSEMVVTEAPNPRALPVGMLARVVQDLGGRPRVVPQVSQAVSHALELGAKQGAPVIITGSIFVVGEAMAHLGVKAEGKAY